MFNDGYSLSDIAAVNGNRNDGWGGNNSWWIILLFFFAFGGFGGGWGNNRNNGECQEAISYGFDMNGLENGIRGAQNGICDGFYAMNTTVRDGFAGVQNGLCQGFSEVATTATQNAHNIAQQVAAVDVNNMRNTFDLSTQLNTMAANQAACCCATERLIESGFNSVNNNITNQACETRRSVCDSTRDIMENNNAGVRSILDFLTQDKIASLTAENQALRFNQSQQLQNAYLINQLGPKTPIPAYTVANPYSAYMGNCGCGCNNGCGC